jgi:hypothetical protein
MLTLIDRNGVVQSVHVGFNLTIKATLRKELDTLLAGKNLASPEDVEAKIRRP